MKLPGDPAAGAGLAAWANWSIWLSRLDPSDPEVAAARTRADAMLTTKPRAPDPAYNASPGGHIKRMSEEEAAINRAVELAALPRIGTSRIDDVSALVNRLEDIAFQVAALRERFQQQNHLEWCAMADALDDVMDVLDAVRPVPGRAAGDVDVALRK